MNINDTNTLHNIARMAYGSNEKDSGGRGYMGVIKDEQGRLRVIKYDTHFSQASSANKNDLSQRVAAQLLRDILVEIADRSGLSDAQVSAIRDKLGIVDNKDVYDPPKKLLEREIVAAVVKMIDKNIWSKAISNDINIKEYSSKGKDTRFSTVAQNVGVAETGAILKPLVNDKKSLEKQVNINKGFKCLLNEVKSGVYERVKSCLGLIKPTEAKNLYEAEEAADRLLSHSENNHQSLDKDLETISKVYGLDEKKMNKLKSAVQDAWNSDVKDNKYYNILEDKLNEIRSGDLEKWKNLQKKYQDVCFEMGLLEGNKLSHEEIDKIKKERIAKLTIRKVIIREGEHEVPNNAFKDFARFFEGNEDPTKTLLEKFGCSLDDLEKLEELGKSYSEAYDEANKEFDNFESALSKTLKNEDGITSWFEMLKNDFKAKLDSSSGDVVASLKKLKQQLSNLPKTIEKCLNDNKLTINDLLNKDLAKLFSMEADIKKAEEDAASDTKRADREKRDFLQGKANLMADLPNLGKELGDRFKELNDDPQVGDNLNKLKGIFEKLVNGANIKFNDSDLFKTIRQIYEDLKSVYPSDFVAFFNDFNPTDITKDVVSEIRTGVDKLHIMANMRDCLSNVGESLKTDLDSHEVKRVDDKISELKSIFQKKILESTSSERAISDALKEIEKMPRATFLDDLTVEQLVIADTNEVQSYLATLYLERNIKRLLDNLGNNFKIKNHLFDLQFSDGEKVDSLAGRKIDALIDEKMSALKEKFKNGLDEDFMMYGYELDRFKEKIDLWTKLPVSAFLGLSVDELNKPETEILEPLVLAQERLLDNNGVAMRLQGKPDFYVVAGRLSNFVSGLATKLAKGEISIADATRDVNVIAKLPISALVKIEDFGSIGTEGEIKTKAAYALKQEIFADMDDKTSIKFVSEMGGADVLAFVNSGTLSAKDDNAEKWHNDLTNLASLVADKCKRWSFGAAVRFAVNQYSSSSSTLRRELSEQYTLYQKLLEKLEDEDKILYEEIRSGSRIVSFQRAVRDFCDETGLSSEICNELLDLISLVQGICDDYGKIGMFNETKNDGLATLAALEESFGKEAKNNKMLEDAIQNAATLLKDTILSESSLDGAQLFSKVLQEFKNLTPQQFACLRRDDIEAIKQGDFKLDNLAIRAQNLGMLEKFKPQLESAIDKLSNRLLKESQYFDSDGKRRKTVSEADVKTLRERIDALRQRFESRIVPRESFAEDASGLIERSQRDLAALDNLDFNSFVTYGDGNFNTLFLRLDYLVTHENKFVDASNEAKLQTTSQDGTVDVRIAELKKYFNASVLWDTKGIGDSDWLRDRDNFFVNVAKGKFIEMSPKDFDSFRFMLKKIYEWRATETKKRAEDIKEVVDVANHCVVGLLNGSMTPADVDHRLKWLSSLPVEHSNRKSAKVEPNKKKLKVGEDPSRTGWHRQGFTAKFGDVAKRANDVFRTLAEMAPDNQSRDQMEAFIATFETLLFDKEQVICDVASVTLDAIEYRLKNNLSLSQILKCETYDQLRQTIRDITAVGETFDWFGEQLLDELNKSPIKEGVTVQGLKQGLDRFKTSVTDALYSGTMDLNIVSSRLKVLFDVPRVEFVKSWLAGGNSQITLNSFWQACDKMRAKVKKPLNLVPLESDILTKEIQKNPKLKNVGQAYLYAFEQYELRSSYLRDKATLSERIHFRNFIRGIWKHSRDERAINGDYMSVNLEYGGVLAEHFLPHGINIPDFYVWLHGDPRFACGEDIVFDIYKEVFKRVQASLTDESNVNKNPND